MGPGPDHRVRVRHPAPPRPGGPPLGKRTHFRTDGLAAARRELDENWNGWLSRLFAAVRAQCGGLAPAALPGGTGWQVLERRLLRAVEDLREAYGPDAFDPRRAVALLDEVVRAVGDFGHVNAHGVLRPAADGRHLRRCRRNWRSPGRSARGRGR